MSKGLSRAFQQSSSPRSRANRVRKVQHMVVCKTCKRHIVAYSYDELWELYEKHRAEFHKRNTTKKT